MNDKKLSPHGTKILKLLKASPKPLSAYEIMDQLHDSGIKAPPTVYRALKTLTDNKLVHRIESLNAFMACHSKEEDHGNQFIVCHKCGFATEIHDHRICQAIKEVGKKLKFHIEREMIELLGICKDCYQKTA